jgi:hypothetical protein
MPCHGDIFHIIRQCEGLTNTLSRIAKGTRSRREKLEARFGRVGQPARRTRLSPNWRWQGKPKPERVNWPAVSAPSSNG